MVANFIITAIFRCVVYMVRSDPGLYDEDLAFAVFVSTASGHATLPFLWWVEDLSYLILFGFFGLANGSSGLRMSCCDVETSISSAMFSAPTSGCVADTG